MSHPSSSPRHAIVACTITAALAGCFTKPAQPAQDGAPIGDGGIDGMPSHCPALQHDVPTSTAFPRRMARVMDVDHDKIDDLVLPAQLPGNHGAVLVYYGDQGRSHPFDLRCADELIEFTSGPVATAVGGVGSVDVDGDTIPELVAMVSQGDPVSAHIAVIGVTARHNVALRSLSQGFTTMPLPVWSDPTDRRSAFFAASGSWWFAGMGNELVAFSKLGATTTYPIGPGPLLGLYGRAGSLNTIATQGGVAFPVSDAIGTGVVQTLSDSTAVAAVAYDTPKLAFQARTSSTGPMLIDDFDGMLGVTLNTMDPAIALAGWYEGGNRRFAVIVQPLAGQDQLVATQTTDIHKLGAAFAVPRDTFFAAGHFTNVEGVQLYVVPSAFPDDATKGTCLVADPSGTLSLCSP